MGFFYSVANMHRKYILIREIKENNLNLVFWKKCFMVKSEETLPICHVHKNIEFLCVKNISGLGERHSSLPPKQKFKFPKDKKYLILIFVKSQDFSNIWLIDYCFISSGKYNQDEIKFNNTKKRKEKKGNICTYMYVNILLLLLLQ